MRIPNQAELEAEFENSERHGFHQNVAEPEHRTELANAKRLVSIYGADFRWCDPWGKFLCWDGKRWKVDDGCAMERWAKGVADCVWGNITDELKVIDNVAQQRALLKFGNETASARGIANMLKLARSEKGIPILPERLDASPWDLNLLNGTLNLQTGKLRDHDPRDFITRLAPVTFDRAAEAPLWCAFVDEITAENRGLAAFLRRLAGYWLTGVVHDHCLPFFYGSGANGKSVYINTLLALLGADYSMKAPADLLLAKRSGHPTALTDLCGKRLVACMEVDQGRRLAESLAKELTGGDAIRARRMREDYWEFQPTHKFVIGTNYKPVVKGQDNGIWRRVRLVPFSVTVPPDRQDKQLPEKLRQELPGILNWALDGLGEWREYGLQEPAEVQIATANYKSEMDTIGQFISERCEVGPELRETSAALYVAYKAWCDGAPCTQTEFGKELTERGLLAERGSRTGRKVRRGIALISERSEQSEQ